MSSSPARSTGDVPAFAISANSSEADAPPVWTSDTTSVETGHATAAAATPPAAPADRGESGRRAAAANDAASKARTRASDRAIGPARRARDIDDLPAGCRVGGVDVVAGRHRPRVLRDFTVA